MYVLLILLIEGIKDAWKVLSNCQGSDKKKTSVSHNLDNQFIKQNNSFISAIWDDYYSVVYVLYF